MLCKVFIRLVCAAWAPKKMKHLQLCRLQHHDDKSWMKYIMYRSINAKH